MAGGASGVIVNYCALQGEEPLGSTSGCCLQKSTKITYESDIQQKNSVPLRVISSSFHLKSILKKR